MGVLWEVNLVDFLLITVILGGGAAYLTGRAVALTWRPWLQLVVYTIGLTFAVRFVHYALFHGTLLSLYFGLVDFIILLIIGSIGFRVTRAGQMATQYSWLYSRNSPFSWSQRPQSDQAS